MGVLSYTEAGGHAHNEDAFIIMPHPHDATAMICIVADGQGGQPRGGPAAQHACQVAAELASRLTLSQLDDLREWVRLLRSVDNAVSTEPAAGYTTFVGLCCTPNRVTGISSGDSAAVLLSQGGPVVLTRNQHKNPPIGSGDAVGVPFQESLIAPWRLLAMTDGVWKYVGWQRLIESARVHAGARLIDELQSAARLPGSGRFQDDFTVVVMEADAGVELNNTLVPEDAI